LASASPASSFDLSEEAMTYADRDQLYRSAVEALGPEEAETLMSSLPPMDWTEIATKSDLRELELRLTAHLDRALRVQTQWVFGAVVVQMTAFFVAVVALG
jgi:hypothetical protein